MKNINIIACISSDRGLGRGNDLLWRIPADQRFFRQTTLGSSVVMGGKTFRSIGRPLPGRQNLVLSRQPLDRMTGQKLNRISSPTPQQTPQQTSSQVSIQTPSRSAAATKLAVGSTTLQVFANMSELEEYLATLNGKIFIIGGATLYQHFLPQAQTLYLTEVDAVQPADVYFPEFNQADFTAEILQTGEVPLTEAIVQGEDAAVNSTVAVSSSAAETGTNEHRDGNDRNKIINYRMVKYERR